MYPWRSVWRYEEHNGRDFKTFYIPGSGIGKSRIYPKDLTNKY